MMLHSLRLLTAGILVVPALLLLVIVAPVIALLSIPSLTIRVHRKRSFIQSFPPRNHKLDPLHHHATITRGSSGMGLSIAIELNFRKKRICLIGGLSSITLTHQHGAKGKKSHVGR